MQHRKPNKLRYGNPLCGSSATFQDCELAILRQAVDESEKLQGSKMANSSEVAEIIQILEDFLVKKKLICYGGTAINNILPKFAQFYDKNIEIPDYDFFSMHALDDAKELANIYYQTGYDEVEAKAGMHPGTFKVYVNFLPVADITFLHPILFASLQKDAITIAGIRYAPPNYLRMGMFLELSRPQGDVSRWEKVLKRINLLNRFYPLKPEKPCDNIDFQREMDRPENRAISEEVYYLTRDSFIDQGLVFLGGYGTLMYSKYMPANHQKQIEKIPDFDVLAENPVKAATITKDKLQDAGYKNVRLVQHTAIGEVIPEHVEIIVNGDTVAFLYNPIACHSYNTIEVGEKEVNVGTIDTMLSFYLAFVYADKPYFNRDRILCMAMYLFHVEQKNRLEQKGLLKRFTLTCYGKQETLEEIRAEKARKYEELKSGKNTREFEEWFLKYNPATNRNLKRVKSRKSVSSVVEKTHVIPTGRKTVKFASPEISAPQQKPMKRRRKKHTKKNSDSWPYGKRAFKKWT
jgi:endonuclease YncB( thermonuclease family)